MINWDFLDRIAHTGKTRVRLRNLVHLGYRIQIPPCEGTLLREGMRFLL